MGIYRANHSEIRIAHNDIRGWDEAIEIAANGFADTWQPYPAASERAPADIVIADNLLDVTHTLETPWQGRSAILVLSSANTGQLQIERNDITVRGAGRDEAGYAIAVSSPRATITDNRRRPGRGHSLHRVVHGTQPTR